MNIKKRLQLWGVLFLILWTLFTLYPQPTDLTKSIYRLIRPPINPSSPGVLLIADQIPKEDISNIERFIKTAIPYKYDWQTYNLPWYFPTVEEVFEKGAGDCKARMIVTASVLEVHKESYTINTSPTHVWVDYKGKKDTSIENENVAFLSRGEKSNIQIPKIDLNNSYKTIKEGFWGYMPENKKTMLNVNFQFFLIINYIALFYDIIRVKFRPYFF